MVLMSIFIMLMIKLMIVIAILMPKGYISVQNHQIETYNWILLTRICLTMDTVQLYSILEILLSMPDYTSTKKHIK
jgi:hypothetical protein